MAPVETQAPGPQSLGESWSTLSEEQSQESPGLLSPAGSTPHTVGPQPSAAGVLRCYAVQYKGQHGFLSSESGKPLLLFRDSDWPVLTKGLLYIKTVLKVPEVVI